MGGVAGVAGVAADDAYGADARLDFRLAARRAWVAEAEAAYRVAPRYARVCSRTLACTDATYADLRRQRRLIALRLGMLAYAHVCSRIRMLRMLHTYADLRRRRGHIALRCTRCTKP